MNNVKRNTAIAVVLAIIAVAVLLLVGLPGQQGNESQATDELETNNEYVNTIDTTNLGIEDTEVGTGVEATSGKLVTVHYTGKLEDGSVFDSSVGRGQPFQFVLGAGQVIPGWDAGLQGMKVGGKRVLTIPSDLAYGDQGIKDQSGADVIPGGATLIFEVELLGVDSLEN